LKGKLIDIRVPPPGPNARKIVARADRALSPSFSRFYPLVVERAHGCMVKDVDGNTYIDMNGGIAVLAVGSTPEPVVKAIKEQADKFLHYSYTDFYYRSIVDLANKLAEITPGSFEKQVYYGNSGAEAVEAAMKLVRFHTKRPRYLAFAGGFHGRTMGSLSLTASKPTQVKGFSAMVPGVTHVPYPYCYRCPFHLKFPECDYYCVDFIGEQVLEKYVPPEEVAAIFFEPIQGEGGYVVPPDDYFRRLEKLLRPYGILLVDDEIQSGIGRTGKWFAIDYFGVKPDVVLMAKAMAAGLPLSAMVAKKEIMTWGPGSHASTFGANPVAAAAALATLSMIEDQGLLANAVKVGGHLRKRLEEMKEKYEIIGDVRGKGLMIGAEIVNGRRRKEFGAKHVENILDYAWRHGVLLISCGKSTLRFAPPLVIDDDTVDEAMEVVEAAVARENGS